MLKTVSFICDIFLLALLNSVNLWCVSNVSNALKIICTVLLSVFYIVFIVRAAGNKNADKKLNRLNNGAFLLGNGVALSFLEIITIIVFAVNYDLSFSRQLINAIIAYLGIMLICLTGLARTVSSARQVKIVSYIILLFTWYIPVINIFIFRRIYKAARSEYKFEQAKLDMNNMRKENEICKTKYPILMVHGIFFRDFQFFNYWGRVPKELVRNGAEIYYGNQQSACTIEESARELSKQIEKVIKETGAEKINIIAHSKGGLDCRCALSMFGMDKYTASLTTINTPHCGCKFVDRILNKVPKSLLNFVDRKYNKVFTALGDNSPCFKEGLHELTYENCQKFNQQVQDSPDVYYTSVMSKMNGFFSAGFPLNLGYFLNRKDGKANDGLVTIESALRGENQLMIKHKGKRGISHGDVIDLMRENIKGYDVREFYVDIVKGLKDKGF